jgi:GTP cyclohydrolase FolE2
VKFLPDVAKEDINGKNLHKVGIEDAEIYRADFDDRSVLTAQSAYLSLGPRKGLHMSRIVKILRDLKDEPITIDNEMMDNLASSHNVKYTYWECKWKSLFETDDAQDIKIEFKLESRKVGNDILWYLSVGVPYASVCPCASAMVKEVCEGTAHMQRAYTYVTGQIQQSVSLPDFAFAVISKIIATVDLIPKPYMKRPDELEWCIRASKTNLFVEDAARLIAISLTPWFKNSVVVCKHFESIHEHNVVAVHKQGKGLY